MTELHTLHFSMRNRVKRRVPSGFSTVSLPREDHETVSGIALETFASCVNVGMPMQDALLAVYMTGFENGCAASKEGDL